MKDIFKDRDGKISMARIGAFLTILLGVTWQIMSMVKWEPLPEGTMAGINSLVGVFMVWVTGTKITSVIGGKDVNSSN